MIVAVLAIVVHLKFTACHLGDSVVHCFAGVYCGLQVGVFKRKQGSAGFAAFISAAHVHEDANVDIGGHADGFGEHSDSVGKFGGVVLERLGCYSFAFGGDGRVDGGADDCFVAG